MTALRKSEAQPQPRAGLDNMKTKTTTRTARTSRQSATGSGAWPKRSHLGESGRPAEDSHHANGHSGTRREEPAFEADNGEGAHHRCRARPRHKGDALCCR